MPVKDVVHGSRAVAEGVKLSNINVISAYPITPQTHIVEDLAEMVANGDINAEYIMVESEHSAMASCIGASATGARVFTATSSQGLALMHEMLWIASGMRLPIVMVNANRALSAPINIWNDQSDSIAERDSGWIQLYCETNQEALDTVIMAYRIAEDHDVLLPVMVCMDGFVLTHTTEPVEYPDQETIDRYLPPYKPLVYLNPEDPMTQGSLGDPDYYMEFRRQQQDAMERSLDVIKKADREYGKIVGRSYGIIETYNMEDAEVVMVTMGSLAGTIKDVVSRLNDKKVGLLRVKAFRPFPKEDILNALKKAKVVSVIEKDVSVGMGEGALHSEFKGAFYNADKRPTILGFVAGLGGRDVLTDDIETVIEKSKKALSKKVDEVTWLGLKEE